MLKSRRFQTYNIVHGRKAIVKCLLKEVRNSTFYLRAINTRALDTVLTDDGGYNCAKDTPLNQIPLNEEPLQVKIGDPMCGISTKREIVTIRNEKYLRSWFGNNVFTDHWIFERMVMHFELVK